MRCSIVALWTLCGAFLANPASIHAVEAANNAAASIGKEISPFTLPDFRGKERSLEDFADSKVLVVVFLGNECPLAKLYAPRLVELSKEFADKGVAFVGINSNSQDSITELAAYARQHAVEFPLLKDPGNAIADRFGAVRTPEAFVLDQDRVVRYRGRIDDQYGFQTGAGYAKPQLTRRDLAEAVSEILDGKPVSQPVLEASGCIIGRVPTKTPTGDVTYSNQIARIMQNRCVECHRPGEVAPFTLMSYEEVQGWAETIREVVNEGRMPPWSASPQYGHWANDARMSDEEKQLIDRWIENGCPQGDEKDLPEPRQYVEGWRIQQPDQIIYMADEAYEVPAEGTVEYQYFTVDPGWKEDRWIKASEARPGNRSVVHHIIVFVQPPGSDGSQFSTRTSIGGYAPGTLPLIAGEGRAAFVPAGSKLVFQMHYTPNGSVQKDRSMIGVVFTDGATVKQRLRGGMMINFNFEIPAHADNHEVTAKTKFRKDTLMLKLTPHMHLRGKAFRFELEYPNGDREVLLDVPKYDFNWQLSYEFKEPKLIPKGSVLHGIAHFDNSAENLANPDPSKPVHWGDQTWEEMMVGFYSAVDPNEDLTKEKTKSDKADDEEAAGGE
ncbi:MAG: redoxin domain-containing protein [Planctomycetaceae bacterium]|nr:redoxin domain-containing protein [Planctomycetaceae bacterium]